FNYRKCRERTSAKRVAQFRGAFQQTRVEEENVSRVCFTARRTAQKQRNFAVRLRVLGEIVVEANRVLLVIAEIFTHRGSGEWGDVLHRGRLGGGRCDDDRVIHCAVFGERLYDLRDRGALLTDGDVDANHVAAFLIDDRVQNDGGLAGLAVADDQLAL